MKSTLVALMIVSIAGSALHAQVARPPKPPFGTEIATSDSLFIADVTPSPDGRWFLFSSAVRSGPSHLWVMPANGGAPHQLTDGAHDEVSPAWFPSGKRIAFASSQVRGVMTVDFDAVGGRLAGKPKRASLEEGSFIDVAPDGMRILYIDQRNRLRVIPANGGPATTILDQSGAGRPALGFAHFSRDGSAVYVTTRDRERARPSTLLRVSAAGGPATVAITGVNDGPAWSVIADPSHDRAIVYGRDAVTLMTLRGDTVAVMPPLLGPLWVKLSPDGRSLLKTTAVINTVVRLVPTAGGKPIDATPGKGYDYPVAWSADGKRIYSLVRDSAVTGGKFGVLATEVNSGERRFISFDSTLGSRPWRGAVLLADGRHWALMERRPAPPYPVVLYDAETRQKREVTRSALRFAVAPGGFPTATQELFLVEQNGASQELHAVNRDGVTRLVHTFPHLRAPWLVAVHSNRIAYADRVGDSAIVRVVRQGGTEQQLVAVAGDITGLAWSPDGRRLAGIVEPTRGSATGTYKVLFVEVTEQGTALSPPRFVHTDAAWNLYWTPDGRAVTALEEQGGTDHTRVLRIPLDASQQPTSLTPNERHTFWDQFPSPDGRYLALPVEQFGASTLWSIDVDAAAKAWQAKRGQK